MNYFCDLIDELPGLQSHRPDKDSGWTKGGWYFPLAHYKPQELGGLSVKRFAEAVTAEGAVCAPGCNKPLHTHPLFTKMDVYHHGRPTRFANLPQDAQKNPLYSRSLPVCESINNHVIAIPWFKHYEPELIKAQAEAYKKVINNYQDLLSDDKAENEQGAYSSTFGKKKVQV
jgi:dTDP-4-amino-4,6-dideoxygalactose transaminase